MTTSGFTQSNVKGFLTVIIDNLFHLFKKQRNNLLILPFSSDVYRASLNHVIILHYYQLFSKFALYTSDDRIVDKHIFI